MTSRPSSKAPPLGEGDNRQQCAGCKTWSPATNTNYTLISMQCGWRLSRSRDKDGRIIMRWRCPECWKTFRSTSG